MEKLNKFVELFKKLVEYGQNSNIPVVHRFFSKSPQFFNNIVLYGTAISGFIVLVLQADALPQYNSELKYILAIVGGAVAIASVTKKDRSNEGK